MQKVFLLMGEPSPQSQRPHIVHFPSKVHKVQFVTEPRIGFIKQIRGLRSTDCASWL